MEPNQNRSLIPRPSHELAVPWTGRNRILGEMAESSLAHARQIASANVDLDALVNEGKRIRRREGMTPEDVQAYRLFYQAASAGHPEGQYLVFQSCHYGYGIPKDDTVKLEWLCKSAESGFPQAEFYLGYCYHSGEGVTRDDEEAVSWYRKAAEKGHAEAQNSLADCYRWKIGDIAEAAAWYLKAAEQGLVQAQYNLGLCYGALANIQKKKCHTDVRHARTGEVLVSAKKPFLISMFPSKLSELVRLYADGEIACSESQQWIEDAAWHLNESANWFRSAAEHGHASAQFAVGVYNYSGEGIRPDCTEAVKWFRAAAEQDHAYAQYGLGCCYAKGEGIPADQRVAAMWFRKAVDQGNARSMRSLAKCLQYGNGVSVNFRNAYVLFQLEDALWFQNFLENSQLEWLADLLAGKCDRKEVERECAALKSMMCESEIRDAERIWEEMKQKSAKKE